MCETTLFCFVNVRNDVKIALSMFLSKRTRSNGSITCVIRRVWYVSELAVMLTSFCCGDVEVPLLWNFLTLVRILMSFLKLTRSLLIYSLLSLWLVLTPELIFVFKAPAPV